MKNALMSSERRHHQQTRECSHVRGIRPIHSRDWGSPTSWREEGQLRLYPGARKYQIQPPSWCKLCLLLVTTVLHSLHPPPQMESKVCLSSASHLGKYRQRGQCTSSQPPPVRQHKIGGAISNVRQEQQKVFSLLEFFIFLPPPCL